MTKEQKKSVRTVFSQRVMVYITENQMDRLDSLCKRTGLTKAAILRQGLEDTMKRIEKNLEDSGSIF